MPSQADKLRAIILNVTVIANTLNRPLFSVAGSFNRKQTQKESTQ